MNKLVPTIAMGILACAAACGGSADTSASGGAGGAGEGGASTTSTHTGSSTTAHGPASSGAGAHTGSSTATDTSTTAGPGGGAATTTTGVGGNAGVGGGAAGGACPVNAIGNVYYVDRGNPNADDANPGTMAAPWKTIQAAEAVVQPGDAVVIEPGTYDGADFCYSGPLSGTAAKPITFQADPTAPAGSVIIDSASANNTRSGFDLEPGCDYINIVGLTIHNDGSITKAGIKVAGSRGNKILGNTVDGAAGIGGILVDNVSHVLVQGNEVLHTHGTGTTGHGMYLSGSSDHVEVIGNLVHDNDYVGIHVNGDISEGGVGVVTSAHVAGNVIYKNGQNGINCDGIQDSLFENDVIYDNDRNGIELYQIDALGGSTNNVIVNCTIDQSNHGVAIEVAACAYDNQGSHATPAGCSAAPFDTSTGNVAFDDVLLGAAGADDLVAADDLALSTNLTSATPSLFVDAANGDYTLAPGGPGLGAGVASFMSTTAPVDGAANDIGAFAFGLQIVCP